MREIGPRRALGIALLGLAALGPGSARAETAPPAMTQWDVADDRIDAPARAALVDLSARDAEVAIQAWLLLKAVRSRTLGGIRIESGVMAFHRAQALGVAQEALLPGDEVARCLDEPEGARPLLVFSDAAARDPDALADAILAGFRDCPLARLTVFVTRSGDPVAGAEVVAASEALGVRTDPCRTDGAGRCRFTLPRGSDLEVSMSHDAARGTLDVDALPAEGAGLRFDLADFEGGSAQSAADPSR